MTVTISDSTNAMLRQRMKSRLVWSGTSFSSFIVQALNMQFARPDAPDPQRHQHAGEIDRGEHRGHNADQQDHGETAYRAGAEISHDRRRYDMGHVGVENRPEGLVIAGLDR